MQVQPIYNFACLGNKGLTALYLITSITGYYIILFSTEKTNSISKAIAWTEIDKVDIYIHYIIIVEAIH